jgi:hypothetical protein
MHVFLTKVACIVALLLLPAAAFGQTAPAAEIVGTIIDGNGLPLRDAVVSVENGRAPNTRTAIDGTFVIAGLQPGNYAIIVTRAGFQPARRAGISVRPSMPANVRVTLVPASFSSLQTIGSTSTDTGTRAAINTTPAALTVISNQTFVDQGQTQIVNVLNETPGIITTHLEQNGASEGSIEVPMIRGSLGYQTESLIDGHPLSIGATGTYNPLLLNPALLQNIEVVKGPGAFPTEINSAIGGTVNYRTLEPTRTPTSSFSIGSDQYGGILTSFKATGSTPNHSIDYVFAIATNGTTGPLHNSQVASSTTTFDYLGSAPYAVNGQQIAAPTTGFVPPNPLTPQYAGYIGTIRLAQPAYFCCSPLNTGFHQTGELGKIRFNFSQQTALTLSYLGGQDAFDSSGSVLSSFTGQGISFFNFVPPTGYAGSVPAGTGVPFDNDAGLELSTSAQTSLFQAEIRSAVGPFTLVGRIYSSYERTLQVESASNSSTLNAWGGVPLCPTGDVATTIGGCNLANGNPGPAPTLTFFNGQPVAISGTGTAGLSQLNYDYSNGYSFEVDRSLGANSFALSFDSTNHNSTEFLDQPIIGVNGYQLPPGTGQQLNTVAARGQIALAPNVAMSLGYYVIGYASHYSGDGGVTFSSSSHSNNTPRVAVVAQPNANTSLRFSAGGSIAPPYLSLISAPGGAPVPNIAAAPTYFTQNVNNGQINPETAFGYDLGIDQRVADHLTVSSDIYLTNVWGLFLNSTYQNGTYTCAVGACLGQSAPLYITQTQNLGNSRDEGVELAIVDNASTGFGWRIQGSLMRAFAYDVSNSLYATSAGPFTTNLAVIPNVNFQPSGIGFNGVEDPNAFSGRIPYAQGYAEMNYHMKSGIYGNLGVTFYGNNNSYNVPPFGILSGTVRFPIAKAGSLQLSVFNITGAYSNSWTTMFGGINVPLVNGSHGISTGNLGVVEAGNVGPATFRLIYNITTGR